VRTEDSSHLGCQHAARIAEASVAAQGHLARTRFFHRKGRRSEGRAKGTWGSRCRRRPLAIGGTGHLLGFEGNIFGFGPPKTKMRSRLPSLAFCPSAFLPFCPSAFLPFCLSALLPFCPSALLPFCPSALLPFCPSALPVKISEAPDKTPQLGSSPKRSRGVAWGRHGSFCKRSAERQPDRLVGLGRAWGRALRFFAPEGGAPVVEDGRVVGPIGAIVGLFERVALGDQAEGGV